MRRTIQIQVTMRPQEWAQLEPSYARLLGSGKVSSKAEFLRFVLKDWAAKREAFEYLDRQEAEKLLEKTAELATASTYKY